MSRLDAGRKHGVHDSGDTDARFTTWLRQRQRRQGILCDESTAVFAGKNTSSRFGHQNTAFWRRRGVGIKTCSTIDSKNGCTAGHARQTVSRFARITWRTLRRGDISAVWKHYRNHRSRQRQYLESCFTREST